MTPDSVIKQSKHHLLFVAYRILKQVRLYIFGVLMVNYKLFGFATRWSCYSTEPSKCPLALWETALHCATA